jgi:hypothetical protein
MHDPMLGDLFVTLYQEIELVEAKALAYLIR